MKAVAVECIGIGTYASHWLLERRAAPGAVAARPIA